MAFRPGFAHPHKAHHDYSLECEILCLLSHTVPIPVRLIKVDLGVSQPAVKKAVRCLQSLGYDLGFQDLGDNAHITCNDHATFVKATSAGQDYWRRVGYGRKPSKKERRAARMARREQKADEAVFC